jgi:hypothetical protein
MRLKWRHSSSHCFLLHATLFVKTKADRYVNYDGLLKTNGSNQKPDCLNVRNLWEPEGDRFC